MILYQISQYERTRALVKKRHFQHDIAAAKIYLIDFTAPFCFRAIRQDSSKRQIRSLLGQSFNTI